MSREHLNELNKIKILKRLKRIEGQIRGIQGMIIEERPCPDVLMQIAAVKSALHKINKLVLEDKINAYYQYAGDLDDSQNSLDEIIDLMIKFIS